MPQSSGSGGVSLPCSPLQTRRGSTVSCSDLAPALAGALEVACPECEEGPLPRAGLEQPCFHPCIVRASVAVTQWKRPPGCTSGGTSRYGERVAPREGVAHGHAWCLHPTTRSLGARGAWLLYFQDASTLLLGNNRVAQPIRVTFEREQVGCWETGRAARSATFPCARLCRAHSSALRRRVGPEVGGHRPLPATGADPLVRL